MFSRRVPADLAPTPLTVAIARRRASGLPLLDLTESNPTRAGIVYDRTLVAALADEAALHYDPAPQGLLAARAAVSDLYTGVDANDVILSASTSESYAWLFKLLADAGDRVLAPRPSYPLFEHLARLEAVHLDSYPLRYDGAWHIDLAALEASVTAHTRAIVVVHPNNPTGSFVRASERDALFALCRNHGLALIVDEVFAEYAWRDADRARAPTFALDSPVLAFVLGGLSKCAALPQMKLGWIVIAGPHDARDSARARLEMIADTFLSVGTPVQLALPQWLARRGEAADPIRARIEDNDRHARERMGAASACSALHGEGGWSLVVRVPSSHGEERWVTELLAQDGVLVQPGYFYDFESEAYLVVSLLTDPATFREGLDRLVMRVARDA